MCLYGSLWLPMGSLWGTYGSLWGLYVSLWISMCPYVSLRVSVCLYGSPWGPYGSLWGLRGVPMAPYGVPMAPCGVSVGSLWGVRGAVPDGVGVEALEGLHVLVEVDVGGQRHVGVVRRVVVRHRPRRHPQAAQHCRPPYRQPPPGGAPRNATGARERGGAGGKP